ncbi:MAG: glycoside hydrolase [bacterium]|nr:glycoside hydrolase [bacterium]
MTSISKLMRSARWAQAICASLVFTLVACAPAESPDKLSDESFENVLEVRNVPAQSEDWETFFFADLGAWFGFALPDEAGAQAYGSFPGPFLMTHGRWLGADLLRFGVADAETDKAINLAEAKNAEIVYLPGRLVQRYELDGFKLELQLIFGSGATAMTVGKLTNTGSAERSFRPSWSGSLVLEGASLRVEEDRVEIELPDSETGAVLSFDVNHDVAVSVSAESTGYQATTTRPVPLAPGESVSFASAFSLPLAPHDWARESVAVEALLQAPEQVLLVNSERWNSYLSAALDVDSPYASDPAYRRIAVKALMTLMTNWRSPNGDLRHDGLFPSAAVWYFNGFWAWDSWKHASALARIEPELAKNQIRTMFDSQNEAGMIADVIYADSSEDNWRDTKPPLAAWAVWKVYEASGETDFIEEMLPRLLAYHSWWYEDRDHDGNGLCEYGSIDGTLEAARWESGMDDGLRFDVAQMVRNDETAWSMDQESVDLNSYLYADKLYLASMLRALGDEEKATILEADAAQLRAKIQSEMFDEKTGFFYDVRLSDRSFVTVAGPEGWIPLWAGVASDEQAERVRQMMLDPEKFATHIPFPTIPADHPDFMSGYWRGPVWLDQAYFGVSALAHYGYAADADAMTRRLFDRPQGLKNSSAPIRENYDPRTGEGMKVNHFSWSAAHLLMLYWGE